MLNEEVQEQVLELRKQGYGYKSIASCLKISRDQVRNICRKYGLTGYGMQIISNTIELKKVLNQCLNCGEEINTKERRGRKAKFCSDNCRRSWWKENSHKRNKRESAWYSFVCQNCGKDFRVYGNKSRKFCSVRCSTEYRFGPYEKIERDDIISTAYEE